MSNDTQQTEIQRAEAKLAEAQKQLAEAQEALKRAQESKEWEPSGGGVYARHSGSCWQQATDATCDPQGMTDGCCAYATKAAAQAACDYHNWYQALVKLAADCNETGVPGGRWFVYCRHGREWACDLLETQLGAECLFDQQGAKKAAEILNRQGGTIAGQKFPGGAG